MNHTGLILLEFKKYPRDTQWSVCFFTHQQLGSLGENMQVNKPHSLSVWA